MKRPTKAEIEAVSASPRRFRRTLDPALEVRVYAAGHGGRIPEWCQHLSDAEWDELSATLRELDALAWLRGWRRDKYRASGCGGPWRGEATRG